MKTCLITGAAGFTRPLRQNTFHYTYVFESQKDGKFYMGYTDDLKDRLKRHLSGRVVATKNRRPIDCIYFEACRNKDAAIHREKYLKTGFGRRFLKGRLVGSRGGRVGSSW